MRVGGGVGGGGIPHSGTRRTRTAGRPTAPQALGGCPECADLRVCNPQPQRFYLSSPSNDQPFLALTPSVRQSLAKNQLSAICHSVIPATPNSTKSGNIQKFTTHPDPAFCDGVSAALKGSPQGPPTANRQPPTPNRHQPPTMVQYSFCGVVSCPCLGYEAESVPVNVRFCWRHNPPFSLKHSPALAHSHTVSLLLRVGGRRGRWGAVLGTPLQAVCPRVCRTWPMNRSVRRRRWRRS